ncbi:MAG: alpha/beta hydrolase, partial [Gammaproteobacteria bacterium HGW-Gammaproteobacteria-8]
SSELLDPGIECLPAQREVGAIAGTASFGLGRLFARLEPPHDGTVSVAETRIDGLADHLELPVSHTGLVLSRPVADAVARFLHQGRFGD